MNKRIVSQLCSCIDENSEVLVIGCTNKLHELDVTLRRPGRFDYEFTLRIPNESARLKMLRNMTKNVKISEDVDLPYIARMTPGFVGSDLDMLLREAAQFCVSEHLKNKKEKKDKSDSNMEVEDYNPEIIIEAESVEKLDISINQENFQEAINTVVPASKREGFACVPDITWDDIGGVTKVREELRMAIVSPVRYPHIFESFGQTKPPGVLLVGPPGNGKTLLAKAVANESGLNFIAVNGPELLNMYVGESERAVQR